MVKPEHDPPKALLLGSKKGPSGKKQRSRLGLGRLLSAELGIGWLVHVAGVI